MKMSLFLVRLLCQVEMNHIFQVVYYFDKLTIEFSFKNSEILLQTTEEETNKNSW